MRTGAKAVVGGLVVAVVLGVAGVAALWLRGGWFTDEEGPETTATTLARALSTGRMAEAPFDGVRPREAQRRWDEIVAGMHEAPLQVTVEQVTESDDGDDATATLSHRWDLDGHTWTYRTRARLVRTDDVWRVVFTPTLAEPSLERDEVLDLESLEPERGEILGAGGVPLVTERPVLRFGIDKTQVGKGAQARSARRLAGLLDVDPDSFVDRVSAAGDEAFVEALVLREGDVPPAVRDGYAEIKGAAAISDEMPLAPTREFARSILGTVGPVTAEILDETGDRYEPGDEVGLSGLQQRYDEQLTGTEGVLVEAEPSDGGDDRELFRVAPTVGEPLRTTLDPVLQTHAEKVLADVGPASALVAIRPSDGQLLAAAEGYGSAGYPTATVGQYAPGSTFKVVSSLALLRAGLAPSSTTSCPPAVVVDGKRFENYDDYPPGGLGDIPLHSALANSCNTAFIRERDRVDQSELASAAAALGLGVDHDLGFPAYFGAVPQEAASETEHAASMIGQGKILASPMAMASVGASVAEGRTVVPTLLPDHEPETEAREPESPLTGEEASALRAMMRQVVTGGSATFLSDLPGPPVFAKTGTAEFGTQSPPQTHAWMIAVQGDLAVAAFVEVGDSGSSTAGPLLAEFLRGA